MKSKSNSFVPHFAIVVTIGLSPLHAATVDTTGTTITLNADNPGNQYIGNGALQVSTDGVDGTIALGTANSIPGTEFAMTGGDIIIDSGVMLFNGGFSKGTWTNNKANMTINGTLDFWDGKPIFVNSLQGAGSVIVRKANAGTKDLNIGVAAGDGDFSGIIGPATGINGSSIRILKQGAGTQTFSNLANQKVAQLVINAGAVNLSTAAAATMASQFSGAGNLAKTGAGELTLTGPIANTGNLTVSEGVLKIGTNLGTNANVVIASGASMNLDFAGESVVKSLVINNSAPLPVGTYNSSHLTYGSYFTGTGSLKILPPTGPNDGIWSLAESGSWSDSTKWELSTVADSLGKSATFKAISPVTVTLDSNRTIGRLFFEVADHTLAAAVGASLSLDNNGVPPTVSVASGVQARITAVLASTTGLTKDGNGALTLASASTITGGTLINGGSLILENTMSGGPSYNIGTGATLEFNYTSGTRVFSGGTINGAGNLRKTGGGVAAFGTNGVTQFISLDASSLIDVQAGLIRNEWARGDWSANQADLNVETGAGCEIWDANVRVDAITGSGLINKGWSGTNSLTFGVADGGGTFSGLITNTNQPGYGGAGGGTLNLVKTGAGTQTFTGTTPFRGSLTVNQGILSLGNGTTNTSLSDTLLVTVDTDGKLDLNFSGNDTVASVTLGGTLYTAPGSYNATTHPDFFTGSGSLFIGTDYDTWALNQGLTGGPDDDDDNDGVTNKEEYAFGLLPKSGSSVNPITTQLDKTTGTFSYTRRKPSLGTNLIYSVWFSTDMAGWTKDTGATEGTLIPSGDTETVPVTLSALAGSPLPDKLFIQVRAD